MPVLVSIQYLRAVAAILVMIVHLAGRAGSPFGFGEIGVDIFFVISGFIMVNSLENRPLSPGRFFLNRIIRLAPLYWILTALYAVLGLVGIISGLEPTLHRFILSIAFIPHDNGNGDLFPLVVQGWTLNFEMLFYAILALCLFARRRLQIPLLAGSLVALVLAGLVFEPVQPIARSWTSPLLLEFLAGGVIALLYQHGFVPARTGAAIVLMFAAIALALIWWSGSGQLKGPDRLLIVGLPCALLVYALLCFEQPIAARPIAWLKLLGDASYSIYLTHALVIAIVFRALHAVPVPAYLVAGAAASLVLGVACYFFLERPLTQVLRKAFSSGQA